MTEGFSGTFDGNGHVIRNLTIDCQDGFVGLFGNLTGEVHNLGLVDVNVYGSYIVGGLCGVLNNDPQGKIRQCYVTGTVCGDEGVGLLCGFNDDCNIYDSYVVGSVSGRVLVGGLCGGNGEGHIVRCYAAAAVSGDQDVGGLCGVNDAGAIIDSHWDVDVSGQDFSAGGLPATTIQMKQASTFCGWNERGWTINSGNDYPVLSWENKAGMEITMDYPDMTYSGSGSVQDPFILTDANDVLSMSRRSCDWDKHFVLVNDIDMEGVLHYYPIAEFTGDFNGNSHAIKNLSIDSNVIGYTDMLGCFGVNRGHICDLNLVDVNNSGNYSLSGLCCVNWGIIESCHISGTVSGTRDGIAGFCSLNIDMGIIKNSSAIVNVKALSEKGTEIAGGFVGENYDGATITECYAAGDVSGDNCVGGFIGLLSDGATVTRCYATGDVNGIGGRIGGLIGHCGASVNNSYTTGSVNGTYEVGGFAGRLGTHGAITNCYAVGNVVGTGSVGGFIGHNGGSKGPGTISHSFRNNDITKVGIGEGSISQTGVIGKNTMQMRNQQTFTYVGWDFVAEAANGTEDISDAKIWSNNLAIFLLLEYPILIKHRTNNPVP
jgi:hypothetical protein